MDSVEILPLSDRPEFAPLLAEYCGLEWAHFYPDWNAESAMEEFQSGMSGEGMPMAFLALQEGEVAGTVSIVINDLPDWEHWNPWLASLFVLPAFRGQGIAAKLIATAENYLRSRKVDTAYLFTESAQGLFEKLDWMPMTTAQCHGHPVMVMAKRIENSSSGAAKLPGQ